MRLLNCTTRKLEFVGDKSKQPPYAILSHTWEPDGEEVIFDDIADHVHDGLLLDMQQQIRHLQRQLQLLQNFNISNSEAMSSESQKIIDPPRLARAKLKKGWSKIEGCIRIAKNYRVPLNYIWIDTCCIDKNPSTELSEFAWYRDAAICFAYLADVSTEIKPVMKHFQSSKWFTRGWTLQELIAPHEVVFYDTSWNFIGCRSNMVYEISIITKLPTGLLHRKCVHKLNEWSVAQRLSWASKREVTRAEDASYSLFGLFGINLVPIYGEGYTSAFLRLQVEIIRTVHDSSILAWSLPSSRFKAMEIMVAQERRGFGIGLLAPSISAFEQSFNIVRQQPSGIQGQSDITGRKAITPWLLKLRLANTSETHPWGYMAYLDCCRTYNSLRLHESDRCSPCEIETDTCVVRTLIEDFHSGLYYFELPNMRGSVMISEQEHPSSNLLTHEREIPISISDLSNEVHKLPYDQDEYRYTHYEHRIDTSRLRIHGFASQLSYDSTINKVQILGEDKVFHVPGKEGVDLFLWNSDKDERIEIHIGVDLSRHDHAYDMSCFQMGTFDINGGDKIQVGMCVSMMKSHSDPYPDSKYSNGNSMWVHLFHGPRVWIECNVLRHGFMIQFGADDMDLTDRWEGYDMNRKLDATEAYLRAPPSGPISLVVEDSADEDDDDISTKRGPIRMTFEQYIGVRNDEEKEENNEEWSEDEGEEKRKT